MVCKNEIQKYTSRVDRGIIPFNQLKYCSKSCSSTARLTGLTINCTQCNQRFYRQKHEINSKNFCSSSCSMLWQNLNKSIGSNRSKLEVWLEEQLTKSYPNLEIKYNDRKEIGYELDIYVPSLKLAFELNGIFHYVPVFSETKLLKTKQRDELKYNLCHDKEIGLCIINTMEQKRFSPKTSEIYLSIIRTVINDKMGWPTNSDIAMQVSQT